MIGCNKCKGSGIVFVVTENGARKQICDCQRIIPHDEQESPDQPKPSEKMPTRVWLRRVDIADLCECGEGCETDVQALNSPHSIIVTGMDKYLSEQEHTAALAEKDKRIEALENCCKELIAERHPAAFKEWATAKVTMENAELLKRIEALEAALEEIASQAMRETNFKEQYDQDGYGFIIKKCKEALAASAKGE